MDTSNRGKISSDELKVGFRYLGHHIPDSDIQTLMEAVSNHTIAANYFCTTWNNVHHT